MIPYPNKRKGSAWESYSALGILILSSPIRAVLNDFLKSFLRFLQSAKNGIISMMSLPNLSGWSSTISSMHYPTCYRVRTEGLLSYFGGSSGFSS